MQSCGTRSVPPNRAHRPGSGTPKRAAIRVNEQTDDTRRRGGRKLALRCVPASIHGRSGHDAFRGNRGRDARQPMPPMRRDGTETAGDKKAGGFRSTSTGRLRLARVPLEPKQNAGVRANQISRERKMAARPNAQSRPARQPFFLSFPGAARFIPRIPRAWNHQRGAKAAVPTQPSFLRNITRCSSLQQVTPPGLSLFHSIPSEMLLPQLEFHVLNKQGGHAGCQKIKQGGHTG